MTVRIAIVGCGEIATAHLAALQRHPGADPVAFVDTDITRARALRDVAGTGEAAPGISDVNADAAIIAVPPQAHLAASLAALRAGCHLLVEKPLVRSIAQLDELEAAAAGGNRVVAPALMRRFVPQYSWAREVVSAGTLGDLRRVEVEEGYVFNWPVRSPSFYAAQNGGVLLDTGPHVLDWATFVLGPLSFVRYRDDRAGGVETNCVLEAAADSVPVSVELSRTRNLRNRLRIEGSRGTLTVGSFGGEASLVGTNGAAPPRGMASVGDLFDAQLDAWLAMLDGRVDPRAATLEDVRANLTLIDSAYARPERLEFAWQ